MTVEGFLWGVASSAYQTEGAPTADGRGPSVWDVYSHRPGATAGGDTGDVACESYRRWRDDVELVAGLGAGAYRFSISWSRVQPEGRGRANPVALDHYRRLCETLRDQGIAPLPTLVHFDHPQALEERGGWASRETAGRFADYAELLAAALGDVAKLWFTINEPSVVTAFGYAQGRHAPGRTDPSAALAAAHHQLLGHGLATQALRAASPGAVSVGLPLALSPARPLRPDEAGDRDAARRFDGVWNRWYLDPVTGGGYPADVLADLDDEGVAPPRDWEADLATIAQPLDLLGVNYYFPQVVSAGAPPDPPQPGLDGVAFPEPTGETTAMGWPVDPGGLGELLARLHRDHPSLPLLVSENGIALDEQPDPSGRVRDDRRIAFLGDHLEVLRRAMDDGVDVRGYLVWTLVDNFEWAEGYAKRFGLVRMAHPGDERVPKASYDWFRDVIAAGGIRTYQA